MDEQIHVVIFQNYILLSFIHLVCSLWFWVTNSSPVNKLPFVNQHYYSHNWWANFNGLWNQFLIFESLWSRWVSSSIVVLFISCCIESPLGWSTCFCFKCIFCKNCLKSIFFCIYFAIRSWRLYFHTVLVTFISRCFKWQPSASQWYSCQHFHFTQWSLNHHLCNDSWWAITFLGIESHKINFCSLMLFCGSLL